ncbi:MAG TPA: LysR family transcriptional regulator [Anaeromyxobacteraceae bacterium]|nr:LysR family transcriptional regulator [Anaeromyxobacteraceae bacterium]
MTSWDDLRLLLAVCRSGTLTAAARAMGLSQPTVSRRMAALARRHGEALFETVAGRYVPTAAGRELSTRAERLEREIDALASEADHLGARPEGAVRLSAPEGFGLAVLAPRLEAFRREHPGIDLLLVAEARVVDLSRREADLALRFVRPSQRELVIRRLGWYGSCLCASTGYLREHPEAATEGPADVVAMHESMEASVESVWLRTHHPRAHVRVRAHTTLAVRAAVLAGAGAGVLPDYLASHPELRALGPPSVKRDVFLAHHRALRGSARVRAVGRFVADCFAARL